MTIFNCRLIKLPRISDPRGNLTFAESDKHFPFNLKRIYYLSEVPEGSVRGGHAHRALHQLVIPVSGSFDIHLDDGHDKKTMKLSESDQGLYICPMIWRDIDNFSEDALCLVLASDFYNEADYYRNYSDFIKDVKLRISK
jgi:dTDP-4-dehydrorhamnose 3,5-epimerase-like enzyme